MNNQQVTLGKIIVTPRARNSMAKQGIQASALLQQHFNDNWDIDFNSMSLPDDFQVSRIMSSQKMPVGELWVITEFDRQVTTITLPDESN